MKKSLKISEAAFKMEGKMPLVQAIPLGLQHVLAMFVGNLTPLADHYRVPVGWPAVNLQIYSSALLQNAMLIAGIVTLVQLFRYRTDRRKSADHHGDFFRIYRSVQ